MSVSVRVPTILRSYTDGASQVEASGETLAALLDDLEARHPGIRARVLDDNGELRRFVNVYVGDEDVRFQDGLATPTPPGTAVSIIPAVAGGASDLAPTRAVAVEEIPTAPHVFTNSVDLAVTPEQLFEVLADAEAWPHWAWAITRVTWTSPGAAEGRIGVGTTRTVEMRGGIVGEEEFSDWDPPRTMAFHFTATNAPGMEAFAEYYRVVPTPEGCRLTWTLSLWPTGVQKVSLTVFGPVLDRTFAWFLRRLRRYTDQRYR